MASLPALGADSPRAVLTGRWPVNPVIRRVGIHLAVLAGYLAAGVAVTWPRAAYLADHVAPLNRDAALFVWDFWWVARSVVHFSNAWFTSYLVAPAGTQLAFHTLMPLPGVLMTPVTLGFGPSFSYNLLSAAAPGLMCYAMYRAARLWLPTQTGAIAAGALFGLSTMMTWNAWWELNLALGAVFLPMALEAAIRLRRRPGWRQAVILGVVLGASLLTDQESAILAALLTVAVLLPWLLRRSDTWVKLRSAALAALAALVAASPQIIAMAQQALDGNAGTSQATLDSNYLAYAATLQQIFAPSPRLGSFGLKSLAAYYYHSGPPGLMITAYGVVLTVLALAGLALRWRGRGTRPLALLWLACTVTALGTGIVIGTRRYVPLAQTWHGLRVSMIMPYTWLVRIPLLSSFREPNRMLELGLVPAALLAGAAVGCLSGLKSSAGCLSGLKSSAGYLSGSAGYVSGSGNTVNWLRYRAVSLVAMVVILAAFEAGSGGAGFTPQLTMPTAMPALDGPIAADHSGSVVLDVPFGVRSGAPLPGQGPPFNQEAMLQATADGHPRAIGYVSRLPAASLAISNRQPFYTDLLALQHEPRVMAGELLRNGEGDAARLAAARYSAHSLHIGWVIVWPAQYQVPGYQPTQQILDYLISVGFRFDYRADGALVYRMS
ncbi:MAG TPA: glycosyltransferase family 39 protein [Streptosporangiaceae bacterium]|nr:glycosyltransferase family 39 protein [Streptosporangiaceae bacterium]